MPAKMNDGTASNRNRTRAQGAVPRRNNKDFGKPVPMPRGNYEPGRNGKPGTWTKNGRVYATGATEDAKPRPVPRKKK